MSGAPSARDIFAQQLDVDIGRATTRADSLQARAQQTGATLTIAISIVSIVAASNNGLTDRVSKADAGAWLTIAGVLATGALFASLWVSYPLRINAIKVESYRKTFNDANAYTTNVHRNSARVSIPLMQKFDRFNTAYYEKLFEANKTRGRLLRFSFVLISISITLTLVATIEIIAKTS